MASKKSITQVLDGVTYVGNRSPEMSIAGGASDAFAKLFDYRNGAIFVGHYSGSSEWERHSQGDEVVMALSGSTTLILHGAEGNERITLNANELTVVPQGVWHRFENSVDLKVMTVTPQPTDHQLEEPTVAR